MHNILHLLHGQNVQSSPIWKELQYAKVWSAVHCLKQCTHAYLNCHNSTFLEKKNPQKASKTVHFALDEGTGNSVLAFKNFQHLYVYAFSSKRVIPRNRQKVQTWTATCVSWGGPTGRSLRSLGTSRPRPYTTRTVARISGVGESVRTFPSITSWPRISAQSDI